MKFLHTADWHLGAKTNGRDRLPEQKKVLDEILSIATYENVDCVIIAGDVFNTASPSAEAEELFFETIEKLSNGGDRFVFVLAGNHDDPTRLSAGLPLACKRNIALVGDLQKLNEKSFKQSQNVNVVDAGKGYIKIKKNEEIATIAYLPYPSESRIKEKIEFGTKNESEMTYAEKVEKWAEIGASMFSEDAFNIFVSHLFMVGAKTKDGEVKVGDIMAVPVSSLPKADYTALGHLHTPQEVADGVFYSGSICELAVNQKNLGVNVFESENGKLISMTQIKLQNTAKYEKVSASSIEDAEEKLLSFDDTDIVELELIQNMPLSASELKALRKKYSCVSNISLVRNFVESENTKTSKRKVLSDEDLFKQFYASVRGFEASDELVNMFTLCKGENDEAN